MWGRWYEIAKFPNWFQRKCVADTSADYSLMPQGGLRVVNRCRLENGQMVRSPAVDQTRYAALLARLTAMGLDVLGCDGFVPWCAWGGGQQALLVVDSYGPPQALSHS